MSVAIDSVDFDPSSASAFKNTHVDHKGRLFLIHVHQWVEGMTSWIQAIAQLIVLAKSLEALHRSISVAIVELAKRTALLLSTTVKVT